MKEDRQDLTTGSIWGKMLFFSIPLVLTNFLQVLFNMADIAVIGQFAGSLSLGAVGSTTTLVTLFTGFLIQSLENIYFIPPFLLFLFFLLF